VKGLAYLGDALCRAERPLGIRQQLHAQLGQLNGLASPIDEAALKFLLQFLNLRRERGLRYSAGLGGTTEVAVRSEGVKILQLD
jgi:hypothetical protein